MTEARNKSEATQIKEEAKKELAKKPARLQRVYSGPDPASD